MAHAWYGGLAALHLYFFSDPHDSVFRTIGFALCTEPAGRPTDPAAVKRRLKLCPYVRALREYLILRLSGVSLFCDQYVIGDDNTQER